MMLTGKHNIHNHRRHVPALSKDRLELALIKLGKVSELSYRSKQYIAQILIAASTGKAESFEVTKMTLPPDRFSLVDNHEREIRSFFGSKSVLSKKLLNAISDEDFVLLMNDKDEYTEVSANTGNDGGNNSNDNDDNDDANIQLLIDDDNSTDDDDTVPNGSVSIDDNIDTNPDIDNDIDSED